MRNFTMSGNIIHLDTGRDETFNIFIPVSMRDYFEEPGCTCGAAWFPFEHFPEICIIDDDTCPVHGLTIGD
jgi:hypothetical protein